MSAPYLLKNGEVDNHPLALNSWNGGENSYVEVCRVIRERVEAVDHGALAKHELLKKFAEVAMLSRALARANDNYVQYDKLVKVHGDDIADMHDFTSGEAQPDELTRFLYRQQELTSIGTASYSHPADWDVGAHIDKPVRDRLYDPLSELDTVMRADNAHFKPKQIDTDETTPLKAVVDRKKIIYAHFQGCILTVVRRSLLIHDMDGTMPFEVKRNLRHAVAQIAEGKADNHYYDSRSGLLRDELEKYTSDRPSTNERPDWIVPLMTTYYAYKPAQEDD